MISSYISKENVEKQFNTMVKATFPHKFVISFRPFVGIALNEIKAVLSPILHHLI